MNRIWSPWRVEYIRADRPDGCVFCDKPAEGRDADNLILARGQHCFAIMNRYPYNAGHLMIVPYAHVSSPVDLPAGVLAELMRFMNVALSVLTERMHPQGFNIGMNLGASAGAGIRDHVHLHIVPRWVGDTNFMPVIGETRVVVESLQECFADLRPAFDRRLAESPS